MFIRTHLVGIEQFSEGRDELQPLTSAGFDIDENQKGLSSIKDVLGFNSWQNHRENWTILKCTILQQSVGFICFFSIWIDYHKTAKIVVNNL